MQIRQQEVIEIKSRESADCRAVNRLTGICFAYHMAIRKKNKNAMPIRVTLLDDLASKWIEFVVSTRRGSRLAF